MYLISLYRLCLVRIPYRDLIGRIRISLRYSVAYNLDCRIAELEQEVTSLEDYSDMTRALAKTLVELNKASQAEKHFLPEIERQTPGSKVPPKLVLAEALFAHDRYSDAIALCVEAGSSTSLLRMEKLRLYIILAKLSHIRGERDCVPDIAPAECNDLIHARRRVDRWNRVRVDNQYRLRRKNTGISFPCSYCSCQKSHRSGPASGTPCQRRIKYLIAA